MNLLHKDIAEALSVSNAAVSGYVKRGMPTNSIEDAAAWRAANVRPWAAAAPPVAREPAEERLPDYHAARARREEAEAAIAELKREEMEGALIRMEAVRIVAARVLATTREALLQIPARMATVLAAEDSPTRVHELLQHELHQALAHLAALPARVSAEEGAA